MACSRVHERRWDCRRLEAGPGSRRCQARGEGQSEDAQWTVLAIAASGDASRKGTAYGCRIVCSLGAKGERWLLRPGCDPLLNRKMGNVRRAWPREWNWGVKIVAASKMGRGEVGPLAASCLTARYFFPTRLHMPLQHPRLSPRGNYNCASRRLRCPVGDWATRSIYVVRAAVVVRHVCAVGPRGVEGRLPSRRRRLRFASRKSTFI